MTLSELKTEIEKYIEYGFGDKQIYIDDEHTDGKIDSIQQNTMPNIEPEYLIIMRKG